MSSLLLKELLEKDMDRKEFLAHVSAGLLAVVGITGLLKTLNNYSTKTSVQSGYGSSPYGGVTHESKK